jgi:hypothetical protein
VGGANPEIVAVPRHDVTPALLKLHALRVPDVCLQPERLGSSRRSVASFVTVGIWALTRRAKQRELSALASVQDALALCWRSAVSCGSRCRSGGLGEPLTPAHGQLARQVARCSAAKMTLCNSNTAQHSQRRTQACYA